MSKSLEELKNRIVQNSTEKFLVSEYGPEKYEMYLTTNNYKPFNEERKKLQHLFSEVFDIAIKAVSEREKKLVNALLSYQGQIARVYGEKIPDAFKIPHSFAEEALKDYRGIK